MGSFHKENSTIEEEQQEINTDQNTKKERAQWLLDYPEPPSILEELTRTIKESIYPRGSFAKLSSSSSSTEKARSEFAFSILKGLFPILSLGKSYNLSRFKKDVMAGLTLASLSIPQVNFRYIIAYFLFTFR